MTQWIEAVLEVSDSEGFADDTVIPTWPKDTASFFPALTVGDVKAFEGVMAKARAMVAAASSNRPDDWAAAIDELEQAIAKAEGR